MSDWLIGGLNALLIVGMFVSAVRQYTRIEDSTRSAHKRIDSLEGTTAEHEHNTVEIAKSLAVAAAALERLQTDVRDHDREIGAVREAVARLEGVAKS